MPNTLTEMTDAVSHLLRQNVVTPPMSYYDLRAIQGSQMVVDSLKIRVAAILSQVS